MAPAASHTSTRLPLSPSLCKISCCCVWWARCLLLRWLELGVQDVKQRNNAVCVRRRLWPQLRVVARCSPSDKYLLVSGLRQLRQQGRLEEVVAMTGEGRS